MATPRVDLSQVSLLTEIVLRGGQLEVSLPQNAARIGLSAVIEEQDGTISYWALRHAAGKPDFHHPDGFAMELA